MYKWGTLYMVIEKVRGTYWVYYIEDSYLSYPFRVAEASSFSSMVIKKARRC